MKRNPLALSALIIVCVVWGTTYLAITIGVHTVPPFLFAAIRMVLSSIVLTVFVLCSRAAIHVSTRMILTNALAGILFFSLGSGMLGFTEKYIPSGLAALIFSLLPIWLVLIDIMIFRSESINRLIVGGLVLGFAGILLVFKGHLAELADRKYLFAISATIAASLCCVISLLITKHAKPSGNSMMNSTIQMFAGGIGLFILNLLFEQNQTAVWTGSSWYALVYLIVFGSLVGYSCFAYAVIHLPVTLVSLYTYANVLVAVLLGHFLMQEKLNSFTFLALIVTLTGTFLVNLGLMRKNAAIPDEKIA